MKTLLVTPPHYYLNNTLAVPMLTSYLKSKGHDVVQKNIDSELYNTFFSKEEMLKSLELLNTTLVPDLEKKLNVNFMLQYKLNNFPYKDDLVKYFGLDINDNFLSTVNKHSDKIINAVNKAFNSLEAGFGTLPGKIFVENYTVLQCCAFVLSMAYFPTSLTLDEGIIMRYSPFRIEDIFNAIEDEKENLLIPYYRDHTLPWVLENDFDIMGVSINHFSQVIPGFTLMYMVKERNPDTHIVIGGALVTTLRKIFMEEEDIWELFDSLIYGMGEYALDELICCIRDGLPLDRVSNLMYQDDGLIKKSKMKKLVDLDKVALPEFTESRPRPIIPLLTSVGCNHGRCVFCQFPLINNINDTADKPPQRLKSVEMVVDDVIHLKEKYNPLYFHFTDTNITAKRLVEISDLLVKKKVDTKYFCFTRVHKEFGSFDFCKRLADGGFAGGYFGLESASTRINKLMNKQVELDDVIAMLKNFHEAGIIANMFCIIGFPSETRDEAMETKEFIRKYRSYLKGNISPAPFLLQTDSEMYLNPEKYKIDKIFDSPEDVFSITRNYTVKEGLSQEESLGILNDIWMDLDIKYLENNFIYEMLEK